MATILIHICCAPCAIYPLEKLGQDDIVGFWYNPSIYPEEEYQRRLGCLKTYAEREKVKVIYEDEHKGEGSLLTDIEGERCSICYEMRLERTARVARERGFNLFTTTLLVSPYQKHEIIKEVGGKIGKKMGVDFLYADFRSGYRNGIARAGEMNLYRQRYCGCAESQKANRKRFTVDR